MEVGLLGKISFENTMNIVCFVQARMTSTRLPKKVMKRIKNTPIIGYVLNSLAESDLINKTVVITTTNHQDDILVEYLKKNNYCYFRGNEDDVLSRFVSAAKKYNPDLIVRITADCPLIDPQIIDEVIEKAISSGADYTSNAITRTYPDGYDVEVIKYSILKKVSMITNNQLDREHVTRYIFNNLTKFKTLNVQVSDKSKYHPDWRITLDYHEDFILIKEIIQSFPKNHIIRYDDIIQLFTKKPELLAINTAFSQYSK